MQHMGLLSTAHWGPRLASGSGAGLPRTAAASMVNAALEPWTAPIFFRPEQVFVFGEEGLHATHGDSEALHYEGPICSQPHANLH